MASYEKARKGTPLKQKKVAVLAEKLKRTTMTVITDYRGMKMPEISDLRSRLRKVDTEYHVTKNSLARIAGTDSGLKFTYALWGY